MSNVFQYVAIKFLLAEEFHFLNQYCVGEKLASDFRERSVIKSQEFIIKYVLMHAQ